MKTPSQIDALSMTDDVVGNRGAYPPLGFRPVIDAELGNGDCFGFYWPYGREDREPIVCETLHDEWGMRVAFSDVGVFIKWLELNDWCWGDQEVEDPGFIVRRFQEVKPYFQTQPEVAILKLREICEDFPENAEYWYELAAQLRRIGDQEGACSAAIRSVASNWAFGMPPDGALKLLQDSKGKEDPLVACSGPMTMRYGGTKENLNYDILKECIGEYLSSSTPILGLLLNQNYGYMMAQETTAFQDRYGFDLTDWSNQHREFCLKHIGDSRTHMS